MDHYNSVWGWGEGEFINTNMLPKGKKTVLKYYFQISSASAK